MFSILQAVNNCSIIISKNTSNIKSLRKALSLLNRQTKHKSKCLIVHNSLYNNHLYSEINANLEDNHINKVIVIGNNAVVHIIPGNVEFTIFDKVEKFIQSDTVNSLKNTDILLLSFSEYDFAPIIQKLQDKTQLTTLEINLDAIKHNLNYFRTYLNAKTKIMVMVKAFSYGSGCYEIANFLEYLKVDYLGVAITDEGVALRKAGISTPIVVMNPDEHSLARLIQYNLEPEIYSIKILEALDKKVQMLGLRPYPVHIKIDTGMNRLGFNVADLDKLLTILQESDYIKPVSVFSHLVGSSELQQHNEFTLEQIEKFNFAYQNIQPLYGHKIMRHILNSGGIENYPEAQYDMVRLGIGLYGISVKDNSNLRNISTLKTKILQTRNVVKGETIGYDRAGVVSRNSRIAIIPIGYADGYNRRFGNGVGEVVINGNTVPIVGNVCMDMCMVDITDIEAQEGDEVIVFGTQMPISKLSDKIGTIPYEILTSIPERIKHVYYTNE